MPTRYLLGVAVVALGLLAPAAPAWAVAGDSGGSGGGSSYGGGGCCGGILGLPDLLRIENILDDELIARAAQAVREVNREQALLIVADLRAASTDHLIAITAVQEPCSLIDCRSQSPDALRIMAGNLLQERASNSSATANQIALGAVILTLTGFNLPVLVRWMLRFAGWLRSRKASQAPKPA